MDSSFVILIIKKRKFNIKNIMKLRVITEEIPELLLLLSLLLSSSSSSSSFLTSYETQCLSLRLCKIFHGQSPCLLNLDSSRSSSIYPDLFVSLLCRYLYVNYVIFKDKIFEFYLLYYSYVIHLTAMIWEMY